MMSESNRAGHYHVVGVAGVGMSALAHALLAKGYEVSGSDRHYDAGRDMATLTKLQACGLRMFLQNGAAITSTTKGVAVSTAIEKDNPDVVEARAEGVPIIHRAALLAELTADQELIAISGTSGKTTVTGMVGWIMDVAGLDPTVVNGGAVINWLTDTSNGNVRVGQASRCVLEADESDKSLLHFHPDYAAITNVSKDHFAIEEVEKLFSTFAKQVEDCIVCGPGLAPLLKASGTTADIVECRLDVITKDNQIGFTYGGQTMLVPLPGQHNLENALKATSICHRYGVELGVIQNALSSFKGIERRLEMVASSSDVSVFDDYAHNPAKLAAAWRAVEDVSPRLLGVWRPHGYAPLRNMMNDLVATFSQVTRTRDRLFILPVYDAGGTADRTVSAEDLVETLRAKDIPAEFVDNYELLGSRLMEEAQSGDAILCMGARDPELPLFARYMARTLEERA